MLPLPSALLLLLLARPTAAYFRVSSIFSSHMVLQRNAPLSLWGSATPGLRIQLVPQREGDAPLSPAVATAAADGSWSVHFGPLPSSAVAYTLTLSTEGAGGGDSVYLDDVLIGDVFFCGGQSNAQIPTDYTFGGAEAIAASSALGTSVRLFQGARAAWSFSPQAWRPTRRGHGRAPQLCLVSAQCAGTCWRASTTPPMGASRSRGSR